MMASGTKPETAIKPCKGNQLSTNGLVPASWELATLSPRPRRMARYSAASRALVFRPLNPREVRFPLAFHVVPKPCTPAQESCPVDSVYKINSLRRNVNIFFELFLFFLV